MRWLEQAWYGPRAWLRPLAPLEHLFSVLARRRRQQFSRGEKSVWRAPVPVIVVGNISIGGTGKTPLTVALIEHLRQAGFNPGVISRGYGAKAPRYPWRVSPDDSPVEAGDEPLMLVRRTGCPLVIDADRSAAAKALLETADCDLILSDDGLQHYALHRDLEIAVVDGQRGLGNGHCLPVGPLREPPERLQEVDFVVVNGQGWNYPHAHRMQLRPARFYSLAGEASTPHLGTVNAIAGIGNPQRFFSALKELGYQVIEHPFPDHHPFTETELDFNNPHPVIMTEKDAVKCRAFAAPGRYYLAVEAEISPAFFDSLSGRIAALKP
ncbi:tetraacyldisaccharide 4'-kinase [Motiliproteus sp. SC1-56]|uniref:tetraacyldisaccharide 4'-kinase n=1 Tax=Motiliproteus sp. SC1-56 TaxID=2799565 RepID=UPI001A8E740B|nr:tetraacyldisaccharide 4'-kinase [Motiliproteus sp. SC1-56]